MKAEPATQTKTEVKAEPTSPKKAKVVVQQVQRGSTTGDDAQKNKVANGQQPAETPKDAKTTSDNEFILTPDYIQQSKFFFFKL